MKKFLKIFVVILTMMFATTAYAQNEMYTRVYGDFGTTTLSESEGNFESTTDVMKGFNIGALRGFNVTGNKLPLFIEPGIDFSARFLSENEHGVKTSNQFMAVSVPINLTYKITADNGFYIAPFGGVRFALNVVGKTTYKYDGVSETEDWFGDDYEFNRFQVGGQVGINFGYKKLNIKACYQWDGRLYTEEDYKVKTSGFRIGVGYNF